MVACSHPCFPIVSAIQDRSATLAPMSDPLPVRVAWRSFPDVAIHATESAVKQHPLYAAAKAGDVQAAFALVDDTLSRNATDSLLTRLARVLNLRWLPVIAEEAFGVNRIPLAVAEALAARLGGTVDSAIGQSNTVGHTGASGWHRLAFPALFRGTVDERAHYVLVDDFVGQGGTLANLRGYVELNGGIVEAATTLTGQARSAVLRVSPGTLVALQSRHGTELENLWRSWFGYDLDALTESEARYLLRAENIDTIRVRLLAARRREDAGGAPADQG